jgi:hemophore-related protein
LSLTAGAVIASAAPDLAPAVNSAGTYPQFVAALNTERPEAATAYNASPPDQSAFQQFLAAPPGSSGRVAMARMVANNPGAAQTIPVLQHVFSVCSNY